MRKECPSLLSLIPPSCIVVFSRELVNTLNLSTSQPQHNLQNPYSIHQEFPSMNIEDNILGGCSLSPVTRQQRNMSVKSYISFMDYAEWI